MKTILGILLVVISCVLFYFTYVTATKEIDRLDLLLRGNNGEPTRYTKIYTTFNHKLSENEKGVYELINRDPSDFMGSIKGGQYILDKKAQKYEQLTILYGLGGFVCLIIGFLILKSNYSKSESIANINHFNDSEKSI